MPINLDTPTTFSKPKIVGQHTRSSGTIGEKCVRTLISRIVVGTKTRRSSVRRRMEEGYQDGNACVCIESGLISTSLRG